MHQLFQTFVVLINTGTQITVISNDPIAFQQDTSVLVGVSENKNRGQTVMPHFSQINYILA